MTYKQESIEFELNRNEILEIRTIIRVSNQISIHPGPVPTM